MSILSLTVCAALALPQGDKSAEPIVLGVPSQKSELPTLHRPSVTFSPDGKKLAWMHYLPEKNLKEGGLAIQYWEIDDKRALSEMKPILDRTWAYSPLRFTPNGRMLICSTVRVLSVYEDLGKENEKVRSNVSVWLVLSGRELLTLKGEIGNTLYSWEALAVSGDGKTLTAVNSRGGQRYKLPDGAEADKFDLEPSKNLVLSESGSTAAGTAADNSVRVWSTDGGKELLKLADGGRAVGLSPDGKFLATAKAGKVAVFDLAGKQLWAADAKIGELSPGLAWSADGKAIALNDEGKLKIVDAATGAVQHTLKTTPGPVAFSPDGRRVAVACPDGTAQVFTLPAKK